MLWCWVCESIATPKAVWLFPTSSGVYTEACAPVCLCFCKELELHVPPHPLCAPVPAAPGPGIELALVCEQCGFSIPADAACGRPERSSQMGKHVVPRRKKRDREEEE